MGDALFGFGAIATILGFVLCVVWIILPFAIFGTKPLLRELVQETRKTNELLDRLYASSQRQAETTSNGNRRAPRMLDDDPPAMRDR